MSNNEDIDVDDEMKDMDDEDNELFNDEESKPVNNTSNGGLNVPPPLIPEIPELSRKDKTLKEVLEMMEDYSPIIPDAVTDYYLAKNGFECSDVRIKRVLALATQKFISDIATDAYEYSRIRSSTSVYNSSNPQTRARQLLAGQQSGVVSNSGAAASGSSSGNNQGKITLTVDDLSSALSEYGLNINRPDFYR